MIASFIVAAINALAGTLIAWVLVRDEFRGKKFVNSLIDLPFALPTIVAGLTLLALYGPRSPVGIDIAYTRAAVILALLFVTLPFVVRTVQPVLIELDREMEEAAASLGASDFTIFRRIILPNLIPAILAGVALAFARAIGEFGSLVLITGNLPFETEVSSVFIFGQIESDRVVGAAAVSVVLLVISFVVLLGITFLSRWGSQAWGNRLTLRFIALGYLFLLLAAPVGLVFFRTFENGFGPAWEAVTTPEAQHAFWLTMVMVGGGGSDQHGLRRDHRDRAGAPALPREGADERGDRSAVRGLARGDRARPDPRLRQRRVVRRVAHRAGDPGDLLLSRA